MRRSMLFVPGNNPKMMTSCGFFGAQAIGRNKKTVLSSGRPSDTGRTKIRTGFSFSRKPQKRYAASMRCICRAADKRKLPAGSMR